ncbi:CAP domain-containing protein [Calidithermus timidus]|uniref:CAP domain-containing protein n=1 Tax=Calidithermus timidus TaxID=307124 RepID=UPI000367FE5A|nr:CAP domain-containing protein [Calidithermus timidus]
MRLTRLLILLTPLLSAAFAQSALELEVLARTNQLRLAHGLGALLWDDLAYKAALGHAQDMLARGYFSHDTPEGRTPGQRMAAAGVTEVVVGENLAFYEGYPDAEVPKKAVQDWMNSPGHRANLLKGDFTHLGVALVRQGRKVVVVQNFVGRPFDPLLKRSPAQAQRTLLWLSGQAPGTLGIFLERQLFAQVGPRLDLSLELPPGSKLEYGFNDGRGWFSVPEGRGGGWQARLEVTETPGVTLRLALPSGQYALSVGAEPRLWRRIVGPQTLELTLPGTLQFLWVGRLQGQRIDYTHRIPLR